jgi:hypothetical protein
LSLTVLQQKITKCLGDSRNILQTAVPINTVENYLYTKMQNTHNISIACQQYKQHEMGQVFHRFPCKPYDLVGIYIRK